MRESERKRENPPEFERIRQNTRESNQIPRGSGRMRNNQKETQRMPENPDEFEKNRVNSKESENNSRKPYKI